ncbi:ABC transporter permease [Acidobacteriota bacterium]
MMLIPKLALRNLLGAGLRTWLNVFVLSLSFITIIFLQGMYSGMLRQVEVATVDAEFGGGQYWQANFDPFDPLSLPDAHAEIPDSLQSLIDQGKATPILVVQGTIYPDGRVMPVMLKGIDPNQSVLKFPAKSLAMENEDLPVLIGERMAESANLSKGDTVTIQWRDTNGTFDARDAQIVDVMNTIVPSIDSGQLWIPLPKLQEMMLMEKEATMVIVIEGLKVSDNVAGWSFKDIDFLLSDIKQVVKMRTIGSSFIYVFLLFLAMLAIFNTQVLSIFRRRKEMGTLMALGVTRMQLIRLFTLEGALNGVMAAILAAIYGIPLLVHVARNGIGMPADFTDQFGWALGSSLFPTYGAALILGTTFLVLIVTTVVSYLPTRKIAKLKPTDALKGKLS